MTLRLLAQLTITFTRSLASDHQPHDMSTMPSHQREVYPRSDFTDSIKKPIQGGSVFEIKMRSKGKTSRRDGSTTLYWKYKPTLLQEESFGAPKERHEAAIDEFCRLLDICRLSKDLTPAEHNVALLTAAKKEFQYTHSFFEPRCRVWSRGTSDSPEARHFDVEVGDISRRQTFLDFLFGRPRSDPGSYHDVVYDDDRAARSQSHRRRSRVAVQESVGVQEGEEGEI